MQVKKDTIKLILILVCSIIYTVTDMYDKYNIFLLIVFAVIVGTAIHFLVEFVFKFIGKIKK